MRGTISLVLVVTLAGTTLAVPSQAGIVQAPRLRIVALSPLTLDGTGFRSRERTRVTASAGADSQTVRVVATRLGTFHVRLDQVAPTRCDLIRVAAVRRSGAIVALKRLPSPACLPERSPGSAAS